MEFTSRVHSISLWLSCVRRGRARGWRQGPCSRNGPGDRVRRRPTPTGPPPPPCPVLEATHVEGQCRSPSPRKNRAREDRLGKEQQPGRSRSSAWNLKSLLGLPCSHLPRGASDGTGQQAGRGPMRGSSRLEGQSARKRLYSQIHTPPTLGCIQAAGSGRSPGPGRADRQGSRPGSHVLPPVSQHLCGCEQKVLLAGLAVVGPLQGRCLLEGLGGGFLSPYERGEGRLWGGGSRSTACSHPCPSPRHPRLSPGLWFCLLGEAFLDTHTHARTQVFTLCLSLCLSPPGTQRLERTCPGVVGPSAASRTSPGGWCVVHMPQALGWHLPAGASPG